MLNDNETAASMRAATKTPAPETFSSASAANENTSKCKPNLKFGLSTKVALGRLHEEIHKVLLTYERQYSSENYYHKVRSAFVKRYESPLGWLSIGTTMLTTLALFIAGMIMPALCLMAILMLGLYVVVRENNLRRTEIFRKTRCVMTDLRLAEQHLSDDWQPCNYPHLCSPMSPCVSLQWTYRGGVIVNLPWALLVRGDYIVLRPGHIAPGPCVEISTKRHFRAHEIYGASPHASEPPVKPVARAPLSDLVCCMESTPYLENLRTCLKNSLKRPPTIYNQQRYLLVTKYIQQWGFISALVISFCAGLLRLHGYGLPTDEKHNWRFVLIESPAATVIPLLPLIFPIIWISMNLWGIARLQCFLKTPQTVLAKSAGKSFEEDLDTPSFDYENISLRRSHVVRTWTQLWRGDSEFLPRSANVVQVLGSITALCCVDKKGILSWPNPTAEKVFFLHSTDEEQHEDGRRSYSQKSINTDSDDMMPCDVNEDKDKERGIVAEVLDLTHDQHCPFRLEFDDHEWKAHIRSLKPLGLAILLNTCSPLTHAHYAQFCGHVTAVGMLDKDLVPVTNRYAIIESSMKSFLHGRCLCELAKQIGFTDHATDRFALEGQLASYRHLQPDVVRRDIRFARQLQLSSKVKVPFPHSLSVVMRENPGGYLSLFTQGTADIILDCCDDFWDGKDLRPLSPQDRKRALDFYQRSALTAYCTAFAYRPLRHGINGALSGTKQSGSGPIAYLELPPESKLRMQHVDKLHCDFEAGHNHHHHVKLSHSISTDSLLFSESKDSVDVSDVESCFEMQCHQVFIGMVTMQYQAQTDIVQLVERLERACIRFVHFSKENELRSRVFSEKMGLESGWNCHISLLSESEEKHAAMTTATANHIGGGKVQMPMTSTERAGNVGNKSISIARCMPTVTINTNNTTTTSNTITTNFINPTSVTANVSMYSTNNTIHTTTTAATTNANGTEITTINARTMWHPTTSIDHSNHLTNNNCTIPFTKTPNANKETTSATTTANITRSSADPDITRTSAITVTDTAVKHQNVATKVMYSHVSTFADVDHAYGFVDADGRNVDNGDHIDIDNDSCMVNNVIVSYADKAELKYLLGPPTNLESSKTLSSSAPGAISNPDECKALKLVRNTSSSSNSGEGDIADVTNCKSSKSKEAKADINCTSDAKRTLHNASNANPSGAQSKQSLQKDEQHQQQRHSLDSAMDENCRSLSTLTESTEQSAPVNFDMSNRAKLPRGIENIRPHLEQVDNVPLQVSLFTDCSAEATRQMLDIMQSYGEIVVCLGSSASNLNAEIFLQADCSIAVEPLYPQVCQDVDAYTEVNIHNNKLRLLYSQQKQKQQKKATTTSKRSEMNENVNDDAADEDDTDAYASRELLECGIYTHNARPMQMPANTISPIYLSRLLNSLPCSISICRDDPLSLVGIIELSRRFSSGLWNCIQYWACCAGAISIINLVCACLSLPPIMTPLAAIYLMSIPVPLIALALAHIDIDPKIMNRATGKKQTEYDTRVFGFVVWCYGCKFIVPVLATIVAYCVFMAHPNIKHIINVDNSNATARPILDGSIASVIAAQAQLDLDTVDDDDANNPNFYKILNIARSFSFLGIVLHFVTVSASFVHRDHSLWQRSPFRNRIWTLTCISLLFLHLVLCSAQTLFNEEVYAQLSNIWPAFVILYSGSVISLIVSELTKIHEIKVNTRYQRRARLDFGTKLGMNSPF